MTDDLTPAQEEAVRRLLAEARETGPMPGDVAARLDAVIADLARTPDTDTPAVEPATVVPLHRRRLPRLVLAAAAVTALGLGTAQVLDRTGEDTAPSDAGGAAESQDSGASALEDDQREGVSPPAPADEGPVMGEDRAGVDALRSPGLRGQGHDAAPVTLPGLDRALRARGLAPVGRLAAVESSRTAARQPGQELDCGPLYDVAGGSAYTSTTKPDTLVVAHPPVNGLRLVEVYDCAGDDPRHSTAVVTLATEE